jgi:hypothetical protein
LNDPSQPLNNFVEGLINFNTEGQMNYVELGSNEMVDEYEGG